MRGFALLASVANGAVIIQKSLVTGQDVIPLETEGKTVWMGFDINNYESELVNQCPPFVPCPANRNSPFSIGTTNVPLDIMFKSHVRPVVDTVGVLGLSPRSQLALSFDIRFFQASPGQTALEFKRKSEVSMERFEELPASWEMLLSTKGAFRITAELTKSDDIVIPSRRYVDHISGLFPSENGRFYYDCDSLDKQDWCFVNKKRTWWGRTRYECSEVKKLELWFNYEGTDFPIPVLKAGNTIHNKQGALCPTNIRFDESGKLQKILIGIPVLLNYYDVILGGKKGLTLSPRRYSTEPPPPVVPFPQLPLFKLAETKWHGDDFIQTWTPVSLSDSSLDVVRVVSYRTLDRKIELEFELLGRWSDPGSSALLSGYYVENATIEMDANGIKISAKRGFKRNYMLRIRLADEPPTISITPLKQFQLLEPFKL